MKEKTKKAEKPRKVISTTYTKLLDAEATEMLRRSREGIKKFVPFRAM